MVIARTALVLAACAALRAETHADDESGATPRIDNLLGFRLAGGALPIGRRDFGVMSLGAGVAHRANKRWRLFGEYEWLWLGERRRYDPMGTVDDGMDGSGHRANVGFRRTLVASSWLVDHIRFHVDLEAGGGLGVASLPDRVEVLPHWLAGLHFGFTLRSDRRTRGSAAWEFDILARAVGTRDGAGMMGGIGLAWSD